MGPRIVLAIVVVSALLQSCVSNKKYQASVGEVQRLTAENNTLQQQVSTCKQQVDQLSESTSLLMLSSVVTRVNVKRPRRS